MTRYGIVADKLIENPTGMPTNTTTTPILRNPNPNTSNLNGINTTINRDSNGNNHLAFIGDWTQNNGTLNLLLQNNNPAQHAQFNQAAALFLIKKAQENPTASVEEVASMSISQFFGNEMNFSRTFFSTTENKANIPPAAAKDELNPAQRQSIDDGTISRTGRGAQYPSQKTGNKNER